MLLPPMPSGTNLLLAWLAGLVVATVAVVMATKRSQKEAKKNPPVGASGSVMWNCLHEQVTLKRKLPAAQQTRGNRIVVTLVGCTDKTLNGRQTSVQVRTDLNDDLSERAGPVFSSAERNAVR